MTDTPLSRRWSAPGGYTEVLGMALPLILSTSAWSVQHFVDRMFLTWYAPEAVAAAMPAGMLNFALMSLFIGTASYVGTFVAQYYGAGHTERIGAVLWQGLYIALIGGVAMALCAPLAGDIFAWAGHTQRVQRYEVVYFQVLCLGAAPVIASSALAGFFSGLGRPWPVMWINVLATAVNLVLDYVLIFGRWGLPEMGIGGAALASVLSGVFSAVVYAGLVFRAPHTYDFGTLRGWRPDRELFGRVLRYGLPSGVQFFLDMAGFTAFILLVGRLGTMSLAATTIAFNINTLAFMPMIGLGIAISVLVGQYLGGGRPDLAEQSTWSGFHLTLVYTITIAACYVLIPQVFIAPFAVGSQAPQSEPMFALAVVLLRFVALYSVFDAMNIVFASAIKGAGDTRFVMGMILLISLLGLVLPTYLAVGLLHAGLMTCWIIVTAYVSILGLAFFWRFRGGKWKAMRVIEESVPHICPTCPENPIGEP